MEKVFNVDNLFFMSSSGHCALTCPYCLIDPVAKNEPSLDRSDFEFIFNRFKNEKCGFIFSGKGDFFASYKKSEKLLQYILDHDVEIMLDINAQFIQEFPELSQDNINKIKEINITMHYHQLKEKNLLDTWANNVRTLFNKIPDSIIVNTIMSPPLVDLWEEALAFYEQQIFQNTEKKINLICDIHYTTNDKFTKNDETHLQKLLDRFPSTYVLGEPENMNLDFDEHFIPNEEVKCPAGQKYFRVWNDGTVQGCIPNTELSYMGNIKKREISIHKAPIRCFDANHCDCGWALLYTNFAYRNWWDRLKSKITCMS